jgi:hypothetical protein
MWNLGIAHAVWVGLRSIYKNVVKQKDYIGNVYYTITVDVSPGRPHIHRYHYLSFITIVGGKYQIASDSIRATGIKYATVEGKSYIGIAGWRNLSAAGVAS